MSYGYAVQVLRTLRFINARDLEQLLDPAQIANDVNVSWSKGLVLRVPVHDVNVDWDMLARVFARRLIVVP